MKVYRKPRLFIDMDGTLAEWRNIHIDIDSSEEANKDRVMERLNEVLYSPVYFSSLEPHQEVIDAIKGLIKRNEVEVFILSCVLPDRGDVSPLKQKNEWLDKYLNEIDSAHRIFVPDGQDKKLYVPNGIMENDTLLDDFTKNLEKWIKVGKGIKLLNQINSSKGTWMGPKISYAKSASEIEDGLLEIILKGKDIKHNEPSKIKASITDVEYLAQFRPAEMEM